MYKLTEYDKFQIKCLIERISNFKWYSEINNTKNLVFQQKNDFIADYINKLLNFWDYCTNNKNDKEKDLYKYCRNIIKKLFELDNIYITNNDVYFSNERIEKLKSIKNDKFDLSKLIRILEEVNIWYKNECYLSVSSLLRMLIDHIPPIFWKSTFDNVVNECSFWNVRKNWSDTSDKKVIKRLQEVFRNIWDSKLHSKVLIMEILPTKETISFIPEFDVLLEHIIKELSN